MITTRESAGQLLFEANGEPIGWAVIGDFDQLPPRCGRLAVTVVPRYSSRHPMAACLRGAVEYAFSTLALDTVVCEAGLDPDRPELQDELRAAVDLVVRESALVASGGWRFERRGGELDRSRLFVEWVKRR